MYMETEAPGDRPNQPVSPSWSVLELRLEPRVSASGASTFFATPHTHPRGADTAPGLHQCPAAPGGLVGRPQQRQRNCTILSQGQPAPCGHGEGGLRPLASFPEVAMASLLSPEQLSEAVTSLQTGRRPSGQETSSPSFFLLPPSLLSCPGEPTSFTP